MELTILHLYPEMMSLYGEYANLSLLRRHLQALDRTVTVRTAALGSAPDFSHVDLIYMGAGTERSQKAAMQALLPYKEAIQKAVADGAEVFFTGNAMEVLGTSVISADGKVWPALGLADFTTVETDQRTPEDVIALPALWDEPVVGFMNKCSVTRGVTTPLFRSLTLGFGNEAAHGPEGYVSGNIAATHITGPVLVKNPAFTDWLIRRLFAHKDWAAPVQLPILPHERASYEVTLRELQARE